MDEVCRGVLAAPDASQIRACILRLPSLFALALADTLCAAMCALCNHSSIIQHFHTHVVGTHIRRAAACCLRSAPSAMCGVLALQHARNFLVHLQASDMTWLLYQVSRAPPSLHLMMTCWPMQTSSSRLLASKSYVHTGSQINAQELNRLWPDSGPSDLDFDAMGLNHEGMHGLPVCAGSIAGHCSSQRACLCIDHALQSH